MERNYLNKGQTILLSLEPDGSMPQRYQIQSVVGEGGSTICYEAIRLRDGQIGKLKEFYPIDAAVGGKVWYYSLKRLENGQLVPGGGTVRKFRDMCEEYLNTYRLLVRVMSENPNNQILKNYIQNGEILYGIADADTSSDFDTTDADPLQASVYIWSSGLVGEGFDTYLNAVRKDPGRRADFRLHEILQTMIALTDCVKAIHTAGLLHLDIKPSNFLVPYDSTFSLNAASISMFDINTVYSVFSDEPKLAGSDGFRAPEVMKGKADNRSDIYSLGALLFNAIVISDSIPDGLYRDAFYPDIDQLVRHSKLITGSDSNSDVRLISKLANILKKCLAKNPRNRYDSCESLLDDLKNAELRSKQHAVSAKYIGQNKQLSIIDAEEKGRADPAVVMQKLLHDHPLYEAMRVDERDIRVLVVGSGTYGQKFIDHCLQAGQMKGYSLSVTAVSNSPEEDMESYLQFRPAVSRFVDVNGSMTNNIEKAYATLRFCALPGSSQQQPLEFFKATSAETEEDNRNLAKRVIAEAVSCGEGYHYIFIALGDYSLNRRIAGAFAEAISKEYACPVCYVSNTGRKNKRKDCDNMLCPVCISEQITTDIIDPQLETMAFKAHIAWNRSLDLDIQKEYREFCQDSYTYSSSVAYALSIKYKLHSIGIILKDEEKKAVSSLNSVTVVKDLQEAANVFSSQILEKKDTDPEAKKKFDTLVDLEQRRWVLHMVTDGWTPPLNAEGEMDLGICVAEGTVKNKDKRTHPCIAFSTEDTPLSGSDYTAQGHKKWDDVNIDPNLDELDHMSVELHQRFRDSAENFKRKNPLQSEDLSVIRQLVSGVDEDAQRAFKQFCFCLKNILNGMESYTRQYAYYEGVFLDSLKQQNEKLRDTIKARLKLIKDAFFPVIEANLYRNYKANNETLIRKIPFIVTYPFTPPHVLTLALAFEDGKYQNGRNEATFVNVASATILSPQKIIYLYCLDDASQVNLLEHKLSAVLNYLGKRNVHCSVSFCAACIRGGSERKRISLDAMLNRIQKHTKTQNVYLETYELLDCQNAATASESLLNYLENNRVELFDGSAQLFDSALDNGQFVNQIVKKKIPYFEFDRRTKQFTKRVGCDYLRYIHDDSWIRIHDMFALMNAVDTRFHLPEFGEEYEALWDVYTGCYLQENRFETGVENWNRLCSVLSQYEKQQKPLARFTFHADRSTEETELVFILPEFVFRTVQNILPRLIQYGAADARSSVSGYTSENCKLTLITNAAFAAVFNDLFSQPHLLLSYYGVEVVKVLGYQEESVIVRCNNTHVTDVSLDPDATGIYESLYVLLEQLQKRNFVKSLRQNPNNPAQVSFTYASPRLKALLTSPADILKIYTYYQVLKTGFFDDMACSYTFRWEEGNVKNELDLVLTKGFRSLIAECVAVEELDRDCYYKLHSIADHFGIGTIKVLIGNTYKKGDTSLVTLNSMQCARGNQLNIITITAEDQIREIGRTLAQLMEN